VSLVGLGSDRVGKLKINAAEPDLQPSPSTNAAKPTCKSRKRFKAFSKHVIPTIR